MAPFLFSLHQPCAGPGDRHVDHYPLAIFSNNTESRLMGGVGGGTVGTILDLWVYGVQNC